MTSRDVWRVGLHLLDHQILDAEGGMAGNVDDLELDERDGELVVTALLSGAAALAERVEGRLGRWLESIESRLAESSTPSRIDFSLVASVDSTVLLVLRTCTRNVSNAVVVVVSAVLIFNQKLKVTLVAPDGIVICW